VGRQLTRVTAAVAGVDSGAAPVRAVVGVRWTAAAFGGAAGVVWASTPGPAAAYAASSPFAAAPGGTLRTAVRGSDKSPLSDGDPTVTVSRDAGAFHAAPAPWHDSPPCGF